MKINHILSYKKDFVKQISNEVWDEVDWGFSWLILILILNIWNRFLPTQLLPYFFTSFDVEDVTHYSAQVKVLIYSRTWYTCSPETSCAHFSNTNVILFYINFTRTTILHILSALFDLCVTEGCCFRAEDSSRRPSRVTTTPYSADHPSPVSSLYNTSN